MKPEIGATDLTVIVVYLIGIVGLGCWAGLRQRHKDAMGKDYFLAGGTLTWPIIGLALFSTNISTIHLVGFAQEGFDNGLAYGNFEWMAPFTLVITALFFAPFYIRSRVATLPDFLEMRYNRACRDWLAVLSIVAAIFIHIGFSLYMGAVLLEGMFGINLMLSIAVTAILTGIYTIVGGLMAVVVTESIQTIILLIGSIVITVIAYNWVGGIEGLNETLAANKETVKMTVLRDAEDPANLPWYAVFLGYPVIGIWYWCADQTIVQRVLGAKDENHARVGPLFAGFIKILPMFIFVLPGLMCYALVYQKDENGQQKVDASFLPNLDLDEEIKVDGVKKTVPEDQRVELAGRTVEARGDTFSIEGKAAYIHRGMLFIEDEAQKSSNDSSGPLVLDMGEEIVVDGARKSIPEDQRLNLNGGALEAGGKKFLIEEKPAYVERGILFINGQPQKNSKNVYGFMIHELLPVGVKGLVAAALLAALMSTVSGALNSIATLFSFDIVKRWRPHTTDRTLVKIGRITTFVAMVVAIAWSPFIERFESMYQGIIALICYIAPPITVVFVLGVLWRRASGVSAQLTLYIGSAMGFVVFLLDMLKEYTGWSIPSMMATFYLLVACVVVQILIALAIPHRHTPESEKLVWGNPLDAVRSAGWRGIGDYRILAAFLVATMIVLYVVFA